jgi:hypothetical protein
MPGALVRSENPTVRESALELASVALLDHGADSDAFGNLSPGKRLVVPGKFLQRSGIIQGTPLHRPADPAVTHIETAAIHGNASKRHYVFSSFL